MDESDKDRMIRVVDEIPFDERMKLMLAQCEKQVDLFKTQLKHSGNDVGFYINMSSVVIWEERLEAIKETIKTRC